MNEQFIPVDTVVFRSKWMIVAAVLLALAVVLSLPGMVMLFNPAYAAKLTADLVDSGIESGSPVVTWRVMQTLMTVLTFLCPAVFAVGLVITLRGNPGKGMGFLYTVSQGTVYVLNGTGILLAAIVAFRVLRYSFSVITQDTGVYLIYGMLVTEGIILVLLWFLFITLRRFVNGICDSAASMAFTLSCGKVDTVPIPAVVAAGFWILGLACILMGLDHMLTLTAVIEYDGGYYVLLPVTDPVEVLAGASLLCSGLADILLGFYMRRYKSICERMRYDQRRYLLFGKETSV